MFASLRVRNYRLYFLGQGISLSGTWMQGVAQSWLVLKLTGSGAALGVVTALQALPVLLLAPYGGLIADRFSKRRLLYLTQSTSGLLALVLGVLVATGAVRLWMVYVLALALGLVNAVDNPSRQTFITELVGNRYLRNAVSLNSIEVNLSRVVGPALAGGIIAGIGIAPCFILNAASYLAVLGCLAFMRDDELHRTAPVEAAKGQLREGLRYAWTTPLIRTVLLMMAVVGTFTFEFQVTLPLIARYTFHGNAASYALLSSAMGVGAVVGGLRTAGKRRAGVRSLAIASCAFGIAVAIVALAPTYVFAVAAMMVVGYFLVMFTSLTNAILQMESEPTMRGRVMALWASAFIGSTLLGAPIIGWVGEHAGPRWSLAVGTLAAVAAGIAGMRQVKRAVRDGAAAEAGPGAWVTQVLPPVRADATAADGRSPEPDGTLAETDADGGPAADAGEGRAPGACA